MGRCERALTLANCTCPLEYPVDTLLSGSPSGVPGSTKKFKSLNFNWREKMKKLLLATAAVGLVAAAAPAHAEVKLDLGGYFKGYGFYTNQDDDSGVAGDSREFDIIRDTEVHVGGETTLDNGLSVGAHIEADADQGDGFEVDESYAYFSGGWGRVNFGSEDGAAYLLQVEAPSADDNLDGLRQYVNPINFNAADGPDFDVSGTAGGLDYDQDVSAKADKLTYLSPIFSGFQVGVSYTPDLADASDSDAENENDIANAFGATYDIGARYEGQFSNVGVILGAGYTHADLEEVEPAPGPDDGQPTDDRQAWNVGADFDIGPFGVGVAYMQDNFGDVDTLDNAPEDVRDEQTTWVVGADYTTGPFKLGASYYDSEGNGNVVGDNGDDGVETTRWTGGVVYTYGPGMTFRGSVSHAQFDNVDGLTTGDSFDATSVLLGTQINF
jgi:outer membrane protein OmpU